MEDKRKIIKFIIKNVNYFEDDSLMGTVYDFVFRKNERMPLIHILWDKIGTTSPTIFSTYGG